MTHTPDPQEIRCPYGHVPAIIEEQHYPVRGERQYNIYCAECKLLWRATWSQLQYWRLDRVILPAVPDEKVGDE